MNEFYKVIEEYFYWPSPDMEIAKIARDDTGHQLFFFDVTGRRISYHLPTNNISNMSLEESRNVLMTHIDIVPKKRNEKSA